MQKAIGYPLPAGDAFEDDLACMMLFYPDRAEYRQALFGSLDYLATWIAWERDDDKRGIDAGRAWALAVLATRECMEMNTCETILSLLTEIKNNTAVQCCDVVDVSDGDRYTDVVEDGEGDVPQNVIDAGYADDAADWEGFAEYKCMISHLMVQNLQGSTGIILGRLDETEAGLIVITALAAIALTIATAGGAILVYGVALSLAGVAGLAAAVTLLGAVGLSSLVDNLEEHYEDLVCAIYNADGSLGALDALKAAIDEHFNVLEATFLKNLNLGPQLKALYAGRYDQQDIAEIMADRGLDLDDYDCTCIAPLTAPSGWEWVTVPEPTFAYTWNVTRIDDDFDEPTSTIMMSATLNAGQQRWEKNVSFPNIEGDVTFYYGLAIRVTAMDMPTYEGEQLAHKALFFITDVRFDKWQMGVNTAQLSGSEWDDMIAEQADFDISWNDNFHNQLRLEEKPDGSGDDEEDYTWSIKIYALRPI